ncbi:SAM-dependent methyltransferase [Bacillus cereus VD133]|uniref:SAM-dependent methyltransferase n=1 Tax=Bacillus cereus VD133 TaxID=1053233 RepID=A0A9W5PKZ0_BACCE|nr:class I SAM-dependent methyltransferase [Bacillus cereus]EOO25928.1 SAM-dependent methyltransferase [Bacillus cereus VD133]
MNNAKLVTKQFGDNAENYVKSEMHAKGLDLQYLVQQFKKNKKNNRLLDIATGGGHVANALAPFFKSVVALDLTEKMLEKAKEFININGHKNVSFVSGNAEDLPFPEASFNTIVCRVAAHHFPNPSQFIREVHRTLEEKGLFILIDNISPENEEYDMFYNFIEKKRDPSHQRALKKTEWISYLEQSGFQMRSCLTFEKRFNFETWCDRMQVPLQTRTMLTEHMIKTSKEIQEFFQIQIEKQKVISFYAEAGVFIYQKTNTLQR